MLVDEGRLNWQPNQSLLQWRYHSLSLTLCFKVCTVAVVTNWYSIGGLTHATWPPAHDKPRHVTIAKLTGHLVLDPLSLPSAASLTTSNTTEWLLNDIPTTIDRRIGETLRWINGVRPAIQIMTEVPPVSSLPQGSVSHVHVC
jgi:hypothetical protein